MPFSCPDLILLWSKFLFGAVTGAIKYFLVFNFLKFRNRYLLGIADLCFLAKIDLIKIALGGMMKQILRLLFLITLVGTVSCGRADKNEPAPEEVKAAPKAQAQPPVQGSPDNGIDPEAPVGSAENVAIPYARVAELGTGPLPAWPGTVEQLNQLVQEARNARIYPNPNPGGYLRRAPWVYGDGCYAKAAHVSALAEKNGYPRPGKVLTFGGWATMRIFSKYLPNGEYWWNYHVVPAYRIGSQVYIIDPILTPDRATSVSEWISNFVPDPSKISIAFCDQNLYVPANRCIGGDSDGAYTGHINDMLNEEYRTIKSLGYDPDTVL